MNKNTKKTPTNVEQLTAVLKWRLAKAPTKDDVTELLQLGIINKEEAKQLLFNEVKEGSSTEREEALKEQIKFLEGVVEKLTNNRGWGWVNTYVYTPQYPTKYWYSTGIGSGTVYTVGANSVSMNSSLSSGGNMSLGSLTSSNTITSSIN